MKIRLSFQGTAPLLCHNPRLSNPLDPFAREIKKISSKRKKTDDDHLAIAMLEFEGGLYMAPDLGPIIPGVNIEKTIVDGARITRQGKQIERGLFVLDDEVPIIYDGPRVVEDMWAANFYAALSVKVGQSRVTRTRPMFRSWALDCEAEVDSALLNLDTVQAIVTDAGTMAGLGDYRPRYGRYSAQAVELP